MLSARIQLELLGPENLALLGNVAPDVFDSPIEAELAREFVRDPRHHMIVALEGGRVVGMVSALHYLHPDKAAQLFVNEIGVADTHRRRGIGSALLGAMLDHGKRVGCEQAWVGTDIDNRAARNLYAAVGGAEEAQPFVMVSFVLEKQP